MTKTSQRQKLFGTAADLKGNIDIPRTMELLIDQVRGVLSENQLTAFQAILKDLATSHGHDPAQSRLKKAKK